MDGNGYVGGLSARSAVCSVAPYCRLSRRSTGSRTMGLVLVLVLVPAPRAASELGYRLGVLRRCIPITPSSPPSVGVECAG